MDFAQLKYLNTQTLYDTANGCAGLRDLFADGVAAVDKKSAEIPESWLGPDSVAAVSKIADASRPLGDTSLAFANAHNVLNTLAGQLDVAKAELDGLIAQATSIPAIVDDFGGVTPLNPLDPTAAPRAAAVAAQIVAVVARANQHDATAQASLNNGRTDDGAPDQDESQGQKGNEEEKKEEKTDTKELIHDGIRLADKALSLLGGGGSFGGQEYGGNSLASQGMNNSLGQAMNAGSGALASGAATYGGTSYGPPGSANGFGGAGFGGAGYGGMSGGMSAAGSRSSGSAAMPASSSVAQAGTTAEGTGGRGAMGGGGFRGGMIGGGRGMGSDSSSGGGTSAQSWLHEDRDPFTTDTAAPPVVGMTPQPTDND